MVPYDKFKNKLSQNVVSGSLKQLSDKLITEVETA